MSFENYVYKKTNREKNLSPKSGLYFCGKCDGSLVPLGKKCRVCNAIQGYHIRLRKETVA